MMLNLIKKSSLLFLIITFPLFTFYSCEKTEENKTASVATEIAAIKEYWSTEKDSVLSDRQLKEIILTDFTDHKKHYYVIKESHDAANENTPVIYVLEVSKHDHAYLCTKATADVSPGSSECIIPLNDFFIHVTPSGTALKTK